MHKRNLRSLRFDVGAALCYLRHRFAAEGSAKVPQKDDEQRVLLGEIEQIFSVLIQGLFQNSF
jgi:hypothetical protein